jgi:hypothetical protein
MNETPAEAGSNDFIDKLADHIVGIVDQHCKRFDRTGCADQIARYLRDTAGQLWEASADEVDNKRLRRALAESVKLQSHYASLLNQYDGGRRLQFPTALSWIQRLEKIDESTELLRHSHDSDRDESTAT